MQDTASVRAQAEALAKAKYAETRDPKSCALFYAALGKKNLLQVLLDYLSGLSTYPEIWTGLAFSRSGDFIGVRQTQTQPNMELLHATYVAEWTECFQDAI